LLVFFLIVIRKTGVCSGFVEALLMDHEPVTLSVWADMSEELKSCIKYSRCVEEGVSDVNVTDIFLKHDGEIDEDAVAFWSQLVAVKGMKNQMETMLSCTFKRGGGRGGFVHRIPLCRSTEISEGFITFVANKIRNTPSLWNIDEVTFTKSKASTSSVVSDPISLFPSTPAPSEVTKVMEQHSTDTRRSYHRRQMKPGNVYDMSATSQRRLMKQVEDTIIGKFNCDQTQAQQIAQMYSARSSLNVSTPSFIKRKSTNENPASNSSTHESSPSHLKIASVEKHQRKYSTFTDDEKIGIVEAFVDCENKSEKRIALTHLKEIMSVKDSRYLTIDLEKCIMSVSWN